MGTSLGKGGYRLVVQSTGDPLTTVYNHLAQPLWQEMGTSGCTEKCHQPIYFFDLSL